MNYRLAQGVELVERDGEAFLMAQAPLTVLRLNRPLVHLIERLKDGRLSDPTLAEAKVLEQLAAKGFLLRLTGTLQELGGYPLISIVIPVLDRAEELGRCLHSLARLDYPAQKLEVIVVDDGSSDDSAGVARRYGARVVSSGGRRRGPAAARNVGASQACGELLAFIDSDCIASESWLSELIPLFGDTATAAVGGLVEGMCSASAVDRYEAVMSSLSLGNRERFGSRGDDTFYLPSCNLLVRRSAFLAVAGFEESMHVGEDVDLTWRLRDAGWTIAYLPAGSIRHEHRSSLRSFMSRRFDYGTSEGMLQKLHPRRRKKFVLPPLPAAVLGLTLLSPWCWWLLIVAAGLLLADSAWYRQRLSRRGVPVALLTVLGGRVRSLGGLCYYLSYHLVRYYAIALAAVALFLPLLWVIAAAALLIASGVDYFVKKPGLSFAKFCGIYFLEQISYGAGVFRGCLDSKGFSSYRVTFRRKMELTA